MSCSMSKPTKWLCAWQRLRSVWSECSLSALRKLGSLTSYWAHSKDSDQTGWMPRLIWVFAGRAGHFVGFYMLLLIFESFFSHNENHVLCPWRSAKKCHNCLTIELYIQKMQVQNNSQCRPWPEHDLGLPCLHWYQCGRVENYLYRIFFYTSKEGGLPSAVGSESDCESRGRWFEPLLGHILSLRLGHEKNSTIILLLPLIQEGPLSVTGERMGTNYW